jgi:uridine kinase
MDVLRQYEDTVRPMYHTFVAPSRVHADVVVDGTAPVAASVAALLARLG